VESENMEKGRSISKEKVTSILRKLVSVLGHKLKPHYFQGRKVANLGAYWYKEVGILGLQFTNILKKGKIKKGTLRDVTFLRAPKAPPFFLKDIIWISTHNMDFLT